jgi:hypothetical protein
MPPTDKPAPFVMPKPPAIVVWRNAPGGETSYAMVTKLGRYAISVMIFPPESRVGVPKDGVRFIDDPWNKTQGINADTGIWEYTEETLQLRKLLATNEFLNAPVKAGK